jgi:hypothetical protein
VWAYEAVRQRRSPGVAQEIVDSFNVGANYPCWYDPDRRAKAVLVRGSSWTHFIHLLVPIPFLLIGGAGLYGWWKRRRYARVFFASRLG